MNLEDVRKIPRFAACADQEAAMALLNDTAERADQADSLEQENQALRQQLAQQEEERIETAVTQAVNDGRLGADQQDTYRNLLKADFKNGIAALSALRPKRLLKEQLENRATQDEGPWEKRQREIREFRAQKR